MKISWKRLSRKTHYWGALICAVPLLIVIITGIILLLKKQSDWIQPPTATGSAGELHITFEEILTKAKQTPELEVASWEDIDRLDVRPGKGIIKVRSNNRWEMQLDSGTGEILQVAYRRSELIESLHDGSWFHDSVKLWIYLPCAIILLVLWITGIYLFLIPFINKKKKRLRAQAKALSESGKRS